MSKKTTKRKSGRSGKSGKQKITVKVKQRSGKPVAIIAVIVALAAVLAAVLGLLKDKFNLELPFGLFGDNGKIDSPIQGDSATSSDDGSESESPEEPEDTETPDSGENDSSEDSGEDAVSGAHVIRFDDGRRILALRTTDEGLLETFPAVIWEGFTFVGWYDDAGKSYAAPFTFTEDMTLTAKWHTDAVYTVTFIVEGETYFSATTDASGNLAETPEKPKKDGYAFKCWNTLADESGEYISLTDTFTEDMTVYAIFTEIEEGEGGEETETPDGNEGSGDNSENPDTGDGSGNGDNTEDTETPDTSDGSGSEGDGSEENPEDTETPDTGDGTGDSDSSTEDTETPETGDGTDSGESTETPEDTETPDTGDSTENGDSSAEDTETPDTGDDTESGDNTEAPESGAGSNGEVITPSEEFTGTVVSDGGCFTASVPGGNFSLFEDDPAAVLTVAEYGATAGVNVSFDKGTSDYDTPTSLSDSGKIRYKQGQELRFKHIVDGKTITQITFKFSGQLDESALPNCQPGDLVYDAETDTTTVTVVKSKFTWVGESNEVVFTFNASVVIISIDIVYEE